jgi:hypothetical protein
LIVGFGGGAPKGEEANGFAATGPVENKTDY